MKRIRMRLGAWRRVTERLDAEGWWICILALVYSGRLQDWEWFGFALLSSRFWLRCYVKEGCVLGRSKNVPTVLQVVIGMTQYFLSLCCSRRKTTRDTYGSFPPYLLSSSPSLLGVACWPHGFEAQIAVLDCDEQIHLDAVVQAGRVWVVDAFRIDELEMAVVAERCHVDVDRGHLSGAYNKKRVSRHSRWRVVLSNRHVMMLLTCILVVVSAIARFVVSLRYEKYLFADQLFGMWAKLMPH